jgi:hypothetical protein
MLLYKKMNNMEKKKKLKFKKKLFNFFFLEKK